MRIESNLSLETKYVRAGANMATQNPDDYCILRQEIGVHKRGFTREGRLKVASAKRPSLVVGHPQQSYDAVIKSFKTDRKQHLKFVVNQAMLLGGATTLVVAGVVVGANLTTAPLSVAMVGKGVAIGTAAGAALAAAELHQGVRHYNSAILLLTSLNDMVDVMHTGELKAWMKNLKKAEKRRNANPDAFDQATSELLHLGFYLPYAVNAGHPWLDRDELTLPSVPTSADAARIVSPARQAA